MYPKPTNKKKKKLKFQNFILFMTEIDIAARLIGSRFTFGTLKTPASCALKRVKCFFSINGVQFGIGIVCFIEYYFLYINFDADLKTHFILIQKSPHF